MAVALRRLDGTPFRATAGSALRKLVAAMQADDAAVAHDLASRIHLLDGAGIAPSIPRVIADALYPRRVLRINYGDRAGADTMREVEPLGYVGSATYWYLVAWCRLRMPCGCSAPTGSPRSRSPPRCPRRERCAARTSTSRPNGCASSA